MGAPAVIPLTSKQGWAIWPAQSREEDIFAVLDKFTEAGFSFCGEITVDSAEKGKYWLFKKTIPGQ